MNNLKTFERIYILVKLIPYGKVLTYGQIGKSVGKCPARIVGYAMSSAPEEVTWQRVVNAKGMVSERNSLTPSPQQEILESEGIFFNLKNPIDFTEYGWIGPSETRLETNHFNPISIL